MSKTEAPRNVVIIGATSMIAQAVIRIYAAKGSSLFLVARDGEKLALVAADARVRGAAKVCTRRVDLNDTAGHAALVCEVMQSLPSWDVVLIAHGVLGEQLNGEREFAAAEAVFRTNFLSVVSLLTHLANVCEQRSQGTIAVISSVAGDRGRKSNYIYGASKAALTTFLRGSSRATQSPGRSRSDDQARHGGYPHDRTSKGRQAVCHSRENRTRDRIGHRGTKGCCIPSSFLASHYVHHSSCARAHIQKVEPLKTPGLPANSEIFAIWLFSYRSVDADHTQPIASSFSCLP